MAPSDDFGRSARGIRNTHDDNVIARCKPVDMFAAEGAGTDDGDTDRLASRVYHGSAPHAFGAGTADQSADFSEG